MAQHLLFSKIMKKILQVLLLASLPLGSLIPHIAIASPIPAPITVTVSNMEFVNNPTTVHIQSQTPAMNEYVYSGAFATTASDTIGSFESWCVDIFQDTYLNLHVANYQRKTATDVLGSSKTNLLLGLATESLGLVVDSRTSSAFQLAMWEIVNEAVNAPRNLYAGNFSAWGASDDSIALATSWLNNLPAAGTPNKYAISVLYSSTHQDLAVFTKVPEPSVCALLALGLFGLGMARRNKPGRLSSRR